MITRSAMALFCEDIREEQSGVHTLIGIYPDNINVRRLPLMLSKFCIYVRVSIGVNEQVDKVQILTELPGQAPELVSTTELEEIEEAKRVVASKGSPTITMISKIVATPFIVSTTGRLNVTVKMKRQEYLAAFININELPQS